MSKIKIAVSSCLLGELVRFDGGHKLDRNIIDNMGVYFEFIPVCPEVGCGLSVPREAMRLEGDPAAPRLMTCHTRIDRTGQMQTFCSDKMKELESENICGVIFKERSPSCGFMDVPLHGGSAPEQFVSGLFANAFVRSFPLMPVEEAERLSNPDVCNKFIESIILYHGKNNA